jgi:hypothetical protein
MFALPFEKTSCRDLKNSKKRRVFFKNFFGKTKHNPTFALALRKDAQPLPINYGNKFFEML